MAIVVELELDGKQAVSRGINEVARQLRDLHNALQMNVGGQNQAANAANKASAAIDKQTRSAQRATGVMSRLIQASKDYNKAVASGDPVAKIDAHDKLQKALSAYRSYNKRSNPTTTSPIASYLGNLIGTTRIGNGHYGTLVNRLVPGGQKAITGGISSLLGGLGRVGASAGAGGAAGASGLAAAAGPIGIALAVAVVAIMASVKAIKLLTQAAEHAAAVINSINAARATTGASRQSLATGAGIAGAIGMTPEQYAQSANSWADRVAQGGYAGIDARRRGAYISPNEMVRSNQDIMGEFNKMVRDMLTMKSDSEAQALARRNPELMPYYEARSASPSTRERLINATNVTNPDDEQAAKDFALNLQTVKSLMSQIVTQVGKPFMKLLSDMFGEFADALQTMRQSGLDKALGLIVASMMPIATIGKGVATIFKQIAEFFNWIANLAYQLGNYVKTGQWISTDEAQNRRNAINDDKKDNQIIDAHRRAMEEHTRALNNATTINGGGQRAQSAVPRAWRYEQLNAAMRQQAMRVGAL